MTGVQTCALPIFTAGLDVVDRITEQEIDRYGRHGPPERPVKNVVIEHVRVERAAQGPVARR